MRLMFRMKCNYLSRDNDFYRILSPYISYDPLFFLKSDVLEVKLRSDYVPKATKLIPHNNVINYAPTAPDVSYGVAGYERR